MPPSAMTLDVFVAIAEPRRREILDILARAGEQTVGALVDALRLPQPSVSKHLAVLREVGVVTVQKLGRSRVYRLNAAELRPVYAWAKEYERFWENQASRIKERAEREARRRG